MFSKRTTKLGNYGLIAMLGFALGCGGSTDGLVLIADAEYDPVLASDEEGRISEAAPGVAQSFTVLASGKFERFWIVLTQGNSADDGFVRITVRPLAGAFPDPNPATSIINAIDVDTSTLPGTGVESFTIFDVGNDPGREVMAGETYAIVVEFLSRTAGTDALPIAWVLGTDGTGGDPYAGGTASENAGAGYVANANMDDYIFRTFILQ